MGCYTRRQNGVETNLSGVEKRCHNLTCATSSGYDYDSTAFFLLFFLVKRFYWFFISFSVKQSSRMVESSSDTHNTTKHIILGCSLGIIFILCVSCFIINKRGWNIRIINDSESVESGHDSQPERSPILCVDTVINANQPCTSRWKSKEKTDHICSW